MITILAITAGSLIVWFAVSLRAAKVIGGGIRLADERESTETPPAAVTCGEGIPCGRRAHIWLVR